MILSRFHEDSLADYPILLKDNLKFREKVLEQCQQDKELLKDVCILFKSDPIWAINTFFWTFDPRNNTGNRKDVPKDMPFILYDYQIESVSEIFDKILIDPGDILIDKSRDMGATWLVLACILWCWLCVPSFQALAGSRKESSVDNFMIDSHFGKLRYMIQRLPSFLRPPDFRHKVHDIKLNLFNSSNGSAIQGEATGPDFSRQGRYNIVMLDEFAAWETDQEAWTATGDSTTCRIVVSTPQGLVNKFAEIRFSNTTKIISMHWTRHPDKSEGLYYDENDKPHSIWYDNECKRRNYNELEIAQELDIDYGASGRPIFNLDIVRKQVKKLRQDPPVMEHGDLIWIVPPFFNERGYCVNRKELKVEFVKNPKGSLHIIERPEGIGNIKGRYVISADVAEGLEQGDYSVGKVGRRVSSNVINVVAKIRGHWSPHIFAEELAKLGVYFGYAVVWPEKNNHGHAVLEVLHRIYSNIGHEKHQNVGALTEFSDKLGWVTSNISKPIMIDTLDKAIRNKELVDPFIGFWEECITFVRDPYGKMSAQNKGKGGKFFDDEVMANAILLQAHIYSALPTKIDKPSKDEKLQEERDQMLKRFASQFIPQTEEVY